MPLIPTSFPGLFVSEPQVFNDSRGYFFESYNKKLFQQAGIDTEFLQDNQSKSVYGVIRGLHYQAPPFAQAKLVSVNSGSVLDVVVDVRAGSPTYGKSFSIVLSAENKRQLFIPRGFAHGFSVLSETAVFFYKCDNYYSKPHERGIAYNDPQLNIDWQIPLDKAIISEKDLVLPKLSAIGQDFIF
jgi:dTDP-4-dehydrorhamnose 3,5-epimerase